jgi:cytochrome c-type biogenesis protein CcmH
MFRSLAGWLLFAFCAMQMMTSAHALPMEEPLPDAAMESRASQLFQELRCVVCQSESLADSHSEMARSMRAFIRGEIQAGKNNEDITQGLIARYGDYILMHPPFKAATWLLWLGPALILLGGAWIALRIFRGSNDRAL